MNLKATGKKIYSIFWEKLPAFLNKTFEVSYTKTSKITGSVLCLICIIGVILNINAFLKLSISSRWVLMALDMFLPFAIALATIFTVRFKSEKARKIFGFVLLFLMPILFITITECLNGVFVYDMTYLGFFANYIVLLIFYFLTFAISGSFKFSYLFVNIPFFVLAFAHSYVMEFRGTPFQPMDFLSVTTAAGVANTYNFTPDHEITTALLLFILLFIFICLYEFNSFFLGGFNKSVNNINCFIRNGKNSITALGFKGYSHLFKESHCIARRKGRKSRMHMKIM